jgi:thiol-disulfide isomerase/thioredoxin
MDPSFTLRVGVPCSWRPQVSELIDFLSDAAGTEVALLADGQYLERTDYVGSAVLNHVLSVEVGGVEAVKANDGCHILPYYTRLEQWNYEMAIAVETNSEWEETVFHTKEDGVLLASIWYEPHDAGSQELLEAVREMADEFRDVVFATVDVTVNTEAASNEVAYWNKKPPALLVFKDGTVVASMDGQDATDEGLRSAILEHRPGLP